MSNSTYRYSILKGLFVYLNTLPVQYVLLRYFEEKISKKGYDVDIFVKSNSERKIIASRIINFFRTKKSRFILNNSNPFCHKLIFITQHKNLEMEDRIFVFELRFFYSTKNKIIFDNNIFNFIDRSKLTPVLLPETEATLIVLRNIFFQREFDERYKNLILNETKKIQSQLEMYIHNEKLIKKTMRLIRAEKFDNLLSLKREFYASLNRNGISFWRLLVFKIQHALISLRNYFVEKNRIFIILGPDGSGKTTTINLIHKLFIKNKIPVVSIKFSANKNKFLQTDGLQVGEIIKPSLFKRLGKKIPLINSFREMALILKEALFYLIFVRYHASKGTIILYDRYYSDIFLKAKKTGLHISPLALFFLNFVHKPLLTFLLRGKAEDILSRKQELTKKQISEYYFYTKKYLSKYFKTKPIEINIKKTPEDISRNLAWSILERISNEY